MKRSALRRRSARRVREDRVRAKAVRALHEQDPRCGMCGATGVELHGHERLGRAQGGDPTRPDMLACNLCNTFCEDNPRAAAARGWKISRKWGPGK